MVPLTSIPAEHRGSIGIFIPQIVDLLKDISWDVRRAGAEVLLKLSGQSMYFIWSGMSFH
jgi:hypothetical protein